MGAIVILSTNINLERVAERKVFNREREYRCSARITNEIASVHLTLYCIRVQQQSESYSYIEDFDFLFSAFVYTP